MLRIIIAVIIGLCCIESRAQSWPAFAEQMEFRIYQESDPQLRNEILMSKLDSAMSLVNESVDLQTIYRDFQRLDRKYIPSVNLPTYYWNMCLLAHLNKDHMIAERHLTNYEKATRDTSCQKDLLGFLVYLPLDSAKAEQRLMQLVARDSACAELRLLVAHQWPKQQRKGPYLLAAAILPGSGLMAEGYIGKGTTSLFLNVASALAIAAMWQAKLTFNLITWGLMLVQKFYLGQINLTDQMYPLRHPKRSARQQIKREDTMSNCMLRYPLHLRSWP
jgi:hypothetical protein